MNSCFYRIIVSYKWYWAPLSKARRISRRFDELVCLVVSDSWLFHISEFVVNIVSFECLTCRKNHSISIQGRHSQDLYKLHSTYTFCFYPNGWSYSMKHPDVQLVLFLKVIKWEDYLLAREANPREYNFEIHYVLMINRIEAIYYIKLECISIGIFGISRIHFLIIL